MNDFFLYYKNQFRTDIQKFFSSIPDESKFHEDRDQKLVYSIQYGRLTGNDNNLGFLITNQEKINFGVALFFTVLVDEVFYTYYRSSYQEFQRQTRTPKFIGNCLTMCRYHLHPKEIFGAMNKDVGGASSDYLVFYKTFIEAIPVMGAVTKSLLINYFPSISWEEFWKKCMEEFPFGKRTS